MYIYSFLNKSLKICSFVYNVKFKLVTRNFYIYILYINL